MTTWHDIATWQYVSNMWKCICKIVIKKLVIKQNVKKNRLSVNGKWGLGERDLVPNLNWFSKVVSDSEGNLCFVPDHSQAGDYVELRMETDVLIVLNTCSHPMNPNNTYQNRPVKLSVFSGEPPSPEDPSLQVCPENQRAFRNTDDYHKLRF